MRQRDFGCIEWSYKKFNAKIRERQTSKEKFRRWINRSDFMKNDEDQSVAKDAVMNSKMSKVAVKNSSVPVYRALTTSFSLNVNFPSPIMFPIVLI